MTKRKNALTELPQKATAQARKALSKIPLTRSRKTEDAAIEKAPGLPPGSLIYVGERYLDEPILRLTLIAPGGIEESQHQTVEGLLSALEARPPGTTFWVELIGLHETDKVAALTEHFGLGRLVAEDILTTDARPKLEMLDGVLFVLSKVITPAKSSEIGADISHYCTLVTHDGVVSFSERATRAIEPVRKRLKGGKGRIRIGGPTYLGWAIWDAALDYFHQMIDRFEDRLDHLDDELQISAHRVELATLHRIRSQVNELCRFARSQRELAQGFLSETEEIVSEEDQPFFRDLLDHSLQAVEETEKLREHSAGLREFYYTAISHRMNEVMKVLTVFSTIFLPLTFLAGIYGMNFEHMPELKVDWAYPVLWGVFIIIAGVMIYLFRRMKWL